MKIVFITIRNVLKRPGLPATERMHLLELLELRARGWNPDSSTSKYEYDSRKANSVEMFKPPTPPQVQVWINYLSNLEFGFQIPYARTSWIQMFSFEDKTLFNSESP